MAFLAPLEFMFSTVTPSLISFATESAVPFLKTAAEEGIKLAAGSAVIGTLFALSGEAVHEIVTDIKNPKVSETNIASNLPDVYEKSEPIQISKKKNKFDESDILNNLIKNLNRSVNKDQSLVKTTNN